MSRSAPESRIKVNTTHRAFAETADLTTQTAPSVLAPAPMWGTPRPSPEHDGYPAKTNRHEGGRHGVAWHAKPDGQVAHTTTEHPPPPTTSDAPPPIPKPTDDHPKEADAQSRTGQKCALLLPGHIGRGPRRGRRRRASHHRIEPAEISLTSTRSRHGANRCPNAHQWWHASRKTPSGSKLHSASRRIEHLRSTATRLRIKQIRATTSRLQATTGQIPQDPARPRRTPPDLG